MSSPRPRSFFPLHPAGSWPINYTYGVVVVPEDVSRRFRAVSDHTGEVYGAAPIDEELRTTDDLGVWLWKQKKVQPLINFTRHSFPEITRVSAKKNLPGTRALPPSILFITKAAAKLFRALFALDHQISVCATFAARELLKCTGNMVAEKEMKMERSYWNLMVHGA